VDAVPLCDALQGDLIPFVRSSLLLLVLADWRFGLSECFLPLHQHGQAARSACTGRPTTAQIVPLLSLGTNNDSTYLYFPAFFQIPRITVWWFASFQPVVSKGMHSGLEKFGAQLRAGWLQERGRGDGEGSRGDWMTTGGCDDL
jgi:hypothetical protein